MERGCRTLTCLSLALVALAWPIWQRALATDAASASSHAAPPSSTEPITPIPEPPPADPRRLALGARLFSDRSLSRDGSRSCSSCHHLDTNGADHNPRDHALDGSAIPFNTPSVFNAALSFRLNWEGNFRTLEAQTAFTLQSRSTMGASVDAVVEKLRADKAAVSEFRRAYGHGPDAASLLDAIATFERSLLTPRSRFDRWLTGDREALSVRELEGYRLFKSLGCVSCHQGVNIGGNLFERHGIFRPPGRAEPALLRVPSLRNVATTAPYFHDGSEATLEGAIRKMASAQLDLSLSDEQVERLAEFLRTLTGEYRGRPVASDR